MDFDEYEYLEKMVENPELEKGKEAGNGSKEMRKDESRSSKRRIDDKESDFDSPSKRKKSERSHDRDQRGSSRHRSRSRDGERDRHRSDRDRHRSDRDRKDRDKDRDRVERNGTGRERNRDKHRNEERDRRDRSRDSERGRGREREKEKDRPVEKERDLSSERGRGREREREKEKDRPVEKERARDRQVEKERDLSSERGREREKEKEMERSRRSRSRSDRPRSSREEIDREKIRDKERERDQDRAFKDRERGSRRHKEKKEEGEEPEADPERDQRTVFAYQINLKADERHVYEFFSRAGKVRDVRLIMDRITRRSKGVGYIEFYDAMSVPMAIALSGQPLLGTPVMVKPSEAEKNLVPSTAAAAAAAAAGGVAGSIGARKLYVGNLHSNLTADQLKKIFEPFGEVELVQLPLYDTGNCKGFGFVQFARLEDARVALSLNGLEIAGRTIKVSAVTDQPGAQDAPPTSGDLDDDEGGGLSLNASTRAILMQRLDRTGTAISITGLNSTGVAPSAGAVPTVSGLPLGGTVQLPSAPVILPTIKTIGVPSECLLLKNMFDPTIETEPDFDLDIKEDTQEECSKYGKLKHIYVDKNTAGFVYLRFENTESAVSAQRALHGRWFAGKMITATFMVPQDYESKFPESRDSN